MAIKLPANLHRNRYGILYFRLTIPVDLRQYFVKAEIYKSLQTASVRSAMRDAQVLAIAFKGIFQKIRQGAMSDQKKTPTEAWDEFVNLPDLRQRLNAAGRLIALEERDAQIARLENEIVNLGERSHYDQLIFDRTLERLGNAPVSAQANQPIGDGRNLSAYIQPYIDSIRLSRRPPSEQTIKSYEVSAKLLVEIIGDKPLHELSHKDRNCYDETIIKVPKNRQKMPATRGKTIAEMIVIPNLTLMSPSTVKDEGLRGNLFLKWVFHHEGKDVPFTLLERFKVDKADVAKRRLYTDDELRLVFHPANLGVDRRPAPFKFWAPLIALHTGARQDEVAQLGLADVIGIDGIPCFNITPALDPDEKPAQRMLDKHVKSDAGRRVVPIHARLIELGLLDYVMALRRNGHEMLFPDLAHAEIKYGALISKWFGRYCDKLRMTDSGLTFHSFRHQVITLMTKNGVQREIRKAVCGHAGEGEGHEVHDDYIHLDAFPVMDRKKAIDALDFYGILDYEALKERAPTVAGLNRALARNAKRLAVE